MKLHLFDADWIYFSWSWNDRNRIWIDTYMSYPCVCGVRLPTWILSLTSKLLIDFECYFQFVSQPGTTWDEIQHLRPQSTDCILTNNSTLPLIMQWQLKPQSHIKLFKIINTIFIFYIIVLCPKNASKDTVTGLNCISGDDKVDTYQTPARFLGFEWVLYQKHTFPDKTQNTWNQRQNRFLCVSPAGKIRIWHCAAVDFSQVPKKCEDLDLSLIYILTLGTYNKFARKNNCLAPGFLLSAALLERWPQVRRVKITFKELPTNRFVCTCANETIRR